MQCLRATIVGTVRCAAQYSLQQSLLHRPWASVASSHATVFSMASSTTAAAASATATTRATATATSAPTNRGAFILFEGCDRCGKTTQAQRLAETLKSEGRDTLFMRFPDRTTPIGKMLNAYLTNAADMDDHAVHLLFAANRWEHATSMVKALAAGKTLVVDRYSHSGVAFSAAKEGMDLEWCKGAESGLPAPDVVLYMTVDMATAKGRGGFGTERYETSDIQTKVKANYTKLSTGAWREIDGDGTIEQVEARVRAAVDASGVLALGSVDKAPVKQLWE